MERFGVQDFKTSLGLVLYVVGMSRIQSSNHHVDIFTAYRLGPLIFSPLSKGVPDADAV